MMSSVILLIVVVGALVVLVVGTSKKKTSLTKEMQKEMGPLPSREDGFYLYDYYFEVRGADFESVESKWDEIVKYLEIYNCFKKHLEPEKQEWSVMEQGGSYRDSDGTFYDQPDIERCRLELEGHGDDEIYKWHLRFNGCGDLMNLVLTKTEMVFQECDPNYTCEKRLESKRSIKYIERKKRKQERKEKKESKAEEEMMEEWRKTEEREKARQERKEARQKKKNGSLY